MSLATKYRPKSWEDVLGQNIIISILSQQIETGNIKNTYIFSGASGCGKTTVARLFVDKINEGKGFPLELDAASNSGVDNVREIVKSAQERSINSLYKAYIIDECHALSNQAWQAFLKCIEEPPKYTIFIFCTTEPTKIPDTIKNRCMRFNFNRISAEQIRNRLRYISSLEGATNYEDTCDYISRICNGEMRNAISLLEKCLDYSKDINIDVALYCLGDYSYDIKFKLIDDIIDGNISDALQTIDDLFNSGVNLSKFIDSFIEFNVDILKYILYSDIKCTKIPVNMEARLKFSVGFNDAQKYYFYILDSLLATKDMLKTNSLIKSTVEVMICRMCRLA